MFDIGSTELLLILVVAIVVIGPKDLPRALYKVGQVIGKAKGMARHFRSGVDAMIREAELEDLQKQWAKENELIMAQTMPDMGGKMTALADETASPDAAIAESGVTEAATAQSSDQSPAPDPDNAVEPGDHPSAAVQAQSDAVPGKDDTKDISAA